ncbi:MAG: ATP-binding cassette domain-containing protein [Deltaproteobacteria bacterium]|nr:ATP-binding cassette domain-containing protein [Deltaproteobacteria bacterium]
MKLDFEEVSVAGLAKSYGPTLALAGVDLSFEAGTVSVIQGSNGSGKSTLLWLLAMLAYPTRGEIRYGQHGVAMASHEPTTSEVASASSRISFSSTRGSADMRTSCLPPGCRASPTPRSAPPISAKRSRSASIGTARYAHTREARRSGCPLPAPCCTSLACS